MENIMSDILLCVACLLCVGITCGGAIQESKQRVSRVPVVEITSGHRTISGQLLHVYGQSSWCTAAMSGQRRARARTREPAADEPSASGPPTKKRAVSKHTAEKWVKEFDKTLNLYGSGSR